MMVQYSARTGEWSVVGSDSHFAHPALANRQDDLMRSESVTRLEFRESGLNRFNFLYGSYSSMSCPPF